MDYPAMIEVRTPERIANWRPLVQWILAIPHLIIVNVLNNLANVVALISWFAIVFTGRLPDGLANFQVMIMRYSARTYAYAGFLHDQYPPFEFSTDSNEPGGTPVDVTIRPALEQRDRLRVALRIFWIIPAALYAFVIWFVAALAWIVGFFAVLFTGRWPDGLRSWVMKSLRVSIRLEAYWYLLTDTYPPFGTD